MSEAGRKEPTRRERIVRDAAEVMSRGDWTAAGAEAFGRKYNLKPDALESVLAEARGRRKAVVQAVERWNIEDPIERRKRALEFLVDVSYEARAAEKYTASVQAMRAVLDAEDSPAGEGGTHRFDTDEQARAYVVEVLAGLDAKIAAKRPALVEAPAPFESAEPIAKRNYAMVLNKDCDECIAPVGTHHRNDCSAAPI